MLIKASRRGNAKDLARYLLDQTENEHVEIYQMKYLLGETLKDALQEIYAISKCTKEEKYLLSVSLNPPINKAAPNEYFDYAIQKIEEKLQLIGQSRIVVFHEKEGRRHAHCVWSLIRDNRLIQTPSLKKNLMEISKEMYKNFNWIPPPGLNDRRNISVLNFSFVEWLQAKKGQEDPKVLKNIFREIWSKSHDKHSLQKNLLENGFILARGDKGGYVALDYRGCTYSFKRWTQARKKDLIEKIGKPENYPMVKDAKIEMGKRITPQINAYIEKEKIEITETIRSYKAIAKIMQQQHKSTRELLKKKQEMRWIEEKKIRLNRLPRGMKKILYCLTGQYKKICERNEIEAKSCMQRDASQMHDLIKDHLQQRQHLQEKIKSIKQEHYNMVSDIRKKIANYLNDPSIKIDESDFGEKVKEHKYNRSYDMFSM